jgi:putative PIN family toxin of toxin-antitoxin system
LISASFWDGWASLIIKSAIDGQINCFTSEDLIEEYKKVVLRDFKISEEKFSARLKDLIKIAHIVQPSRKIFVCEDPDDNKVLEVALEVNANFIISADKHLLKLQTFSNAIILTPQKFIEVISSKKV